MGSASSEPFFFEDFFSLLPSSELDLLVLLSLLVVPALLASEVDEVPLVAPVLAPVAESVVIFSVGLRDAPEGVAVAAGLEDLVAGEAAAAGEAVAFGLAVAAGEVVAFGEAVAVAEALGEADAVAAGLADAVGATEAVAVGATEAVGAAAGAAAPVCVVETPLRVVVPAPPTPKLRPTAGCTPQ